MAWRADSARVVDTPLIDFILEVERKATGAQLASTAAFSLERVARRRTDHDRAPRGALSVRQHAPRRAHHRRAASRLSRAERPLLSHERTTAARASIRAIPGFNYDIVSGVDYTIDVSKPIGERITQLDYNGRPVAPADTFTMALNNYRQTGGGGFSMLRDAPVVYDRQQEIRQLLIDEVRAKGTLDAERLFSSELARSCPPAAVGRLLRSMK